MRPALAGRPMNLLREDRHRQAKTRVRLRHDFLGDEGRVNRQKESGYPDRRNGKDRQRSRHGLAAIVAHNCKW
jgi:hypothetical protein